MADTPDLLIFDLDGTLVDSRRDLTDALNAARAHFGLAALDLETVNGYVGDGVRALVERGLATADPNVVEAALSVFWPHYGAHLLDHTLPYPDVRATLDVLSGRILAVVTNKPEEFSVRILQGLGLAGRFAVVLGGDSGPARKPDPAGIREVLRRTGIAAGRAVMIGDALQDLRAARAAGVRAGAALWGNGRESDLLAARPDFVLRRFADLPAALGLHAVRS